MSKMKEISYKFKQIMHEYRHEMRTIATVVTFGFLSTGTGQAQDFDAKKKYKSSNLTETVAKKGKFIKNQIPYRTIDYQVDTLTYVAPEDSSFFVVGCFFVDRNVIVKFYEPNMDIFHEISYNMIHEQKHKDDHKSMTRYEPMSLTQNYKTEMHSEIAANICELLYFRQKYLEATTDEAKKAVAIVSWDQLRWLEAWAAGEINPYSEKSSDFEKEMAFIANCSKEEWEKNTADYYKERHLNNAKNHLKVNNYDDLAPNDKNYKKGMDIHYTIGGINFSKYFTSDVSVDESIKMADAMVAQGASREEVLAVLNGDKSAFQSSNQDKTVNAKVNNKRTNCYFHYTGKPIYFQWSPEKRVSGVQYQDIIDFSAPFLKEKLEAMKKSEKQQIAQARIKDIRERLAKKKPAETHKKFTKVYSQGNNTGHGMER